MPNDELARTYAQAIYEKAVERWQKQLRSVADALQARPQLLTQLDSPHDSFERKQAAIGSLIPKDADPEVRNFLLLLVSKNQLNLLPQVLTEFDRFVSHGPSLSLARVTSAIPLTADERTKLEARLHGQFGKDLDFDYQVDPSILGGLVVRVGDRIIDGSVAGKLAAMKQKLESAS